MSGSYLYSQMMTVVAVFMAVLLCTLNAMSGEDPHSNESHQDDPPLYVPDLFTSVLTTDCLDWFNGSDWEKSIATILTLSATDQEASNLMKMPVRTCLNMWA